MSKSAAHLALEVLMDSINRLEEENGELRSLARDACEAAGMLCAAYEGSCMNGSEGSMHDGCPIGNDCSLCVSFLENRATELGIMSDD